MKKVSRSSQVNSESAKDKFLRLMPERATVQERKCGVTDASR